MTRDTTMRWTKLKDGGGTETERDLLSSALGDVAPAGARERVAARLGLELPDLQAFTTSAAAPSSHTTKADSGPARRDVPANSTRGSSSSVGAAKVAKLAVIAISGGFALHAVLTQLDGPTLAASPIGAAEGLPPASPDVAPPPALSAEQAAAEPPSAGAATPIPPARRGPDEREHRAKSRFLRSSAENASSSLMREVALLDETRASLRSGANIRALAVLDRYSARFAQGELALEAMVLRVQALVALDRQSEAVMLARDVLQRPGAERYRAELARATDAQHSVGSKAVRRDIGGAR